MYTYVMQNIYYAHLSARNDEITATRTSSSAALEVYIIHNVHMCNTSCI